MLVLGYRWGKSDPEAAPCPEQRCWAPSEPQARALHHLWGHPVQGPHPGGIKHRCFSCTGVGTMDVHASKHRGALFNLYRAINQPERFIEPHRGAQRRTVYGGRHDPCHGGLE